MSDTSLLEILPKGVPGDKLYVPIVRKVVKFSVRQLKPLLPGEAATHSLPAKIHRMFPKAQHFVTKNFWDRFK